MNNKGWPKRLYLLDVSRGIAALSVILWHWQHFPRYLSENFVREDQPMYGVFKLFYEKGSIGVEYFFILSGFIFFWIYREAIENKKVNAQTFFVQRFSRLYPLHLATLIIVALLQALYYSRAGNYFVYTFNDLYHFLLHLGFASNWGFERGWSFNAPVWSVSIEVLLYVVFFYVAFLRLGKNIISLSIVVASFIISIYVPTRFLRGLPLFFLGGVVYHIVVAVSTNPEFQIWKKPIYSVAIIGWFSVIINIYFVDLGSSFFDFEYSKIFSSIIFPYYILFPVTICSLALLEIDKIVSAKQISWVGDITYSSYLLHFPLQLLFALAVSYKLISPIFFMDTSYLLFYFSILIVLSNMVYQRFEMPMQKNIRDWFVRTQKV